MKTLSIIIISALFGLVIGYWLGNNSCENDLIFIEDSIKNSDDYYQIVKSNFDI